MLFESVKPEGITIGDVEVRMAGRKVILATGELRTPVGEIL